MDDFDWLRANAAMLLLLRNEHAPLVNDVINAHRSEVELGNEIDPDLFCHLATLATAVEIKQSSEYYAYQVVAAFVCGVVVGGPSQPDVIAPGNIPVEIKTGSIDDKALIQLQRYMKAMKSDKGILCGKVLDIVLPLGIEFIAITYDAKARAYQIVDNGAHNA